MPFLNRYRYILLDVEHRHFLFLDVSSFFSGFRFPFWLYLFVYHIFHLLFKGILINLHPFNVYCILKIQRKIEGMVNPLLWLNIAMNLWNISNSIKLWEIVTHDWSKILFAEFRTFFDLEDIIFNWVFAIRIDPCTENRQTVQVLESGRNVSIVLNCLICFLSLLKYSFRLHAELIQDKTNAFMHVLQVNLWLFAKALNIMFGLEIGTGIVSMNFSMLMELTKMAFVWLKVELIFGVLRWYNKSNSGFQGTDMADSIFAFIDTFS